MDILILIIVIIAIIWLLSLMVGSVKSALPPQVWNAIIVIAVILLIVWLVTGRSIF